MAEVTMEMMMQKKDALLKLMAQAQQETDTEKSVELAAQLMAMGKEMESLGNQMREQTAVKRGIAKVQVVLTPDQRKRVLDKHGIALETLIIDDEAGAMNKTMPGQRPEYIEMLAMQEAERRKQSAEAEKIVRAELERAMEEIEAVGVAELSEQLARLKEDPNFAGGLLKKK